VLNLSRRHGFERNDPMVPGQAETVTFRLNDLGQRLSKGARLRLALSTNYWPILWPAPAPVTMTLHAADCRLSLPVVTPMAAMRSRPFPPAEAAPNVAYSQLAVPGASGVEEERPRADDRHHQSCPPGGWRSMASSSTAAAAPPRSRAIPQRLGGDRMALCHAAAIGRSARSAARGSPAAVSISIQHHLDAFEGSGSSPPP
jgi:hypothetical protein